MARHAGTGRKRRTGRPAPKTRVSLWSGVLALALALVIIGSRQLPPLRQTKSQSKESHPDTIQAGTRAVPSSAKSSVLGSAGVPPSPPASIPDSGVEASTSLKPSDAPSGTSSLLLYASLVLAVLSLAGVAWLLLFQSRLKREVRSLASRVHRASEDAVKARTAVNAPPKQSNELRELQLKVTALEKENEKRKESASEAQRREGTPDRKIATLKALPILDVPGSGVETQEFIPGAVTAEEIIERTNSSRPMLEIHWKPGSPSAHVRIHSEFVFAALNADFLRGAFEIDGAGGPGHYETIEPAVVTWSHDARTGTIQRLGRARART
ncbi:MAG: hypothetical protein JWM95_45 [Gemmatimonadetes bacterium]|nr:hypothetical protein [Gemmatimonadota bacterium]